MFTAVIPLRAWSKRIKWKNTIILNNKPLFCYTVDEALLSKNVDKIILSTDDENVKNIANNRYKNDIVSGKIKLLDRDPEFSWDWASTIDLILNDICKKEKDIDNIVLLQATSPFRSHEHISESLEKFLKHDTDSLVSITTVTDNPFWQYFVKWERIVSIMWDKYVWKRSQDLPKTYILNWAIYIINKNTLINKKSFITDNTFWYLMDKYHSVDIDTEDDLLYAKFLIDNKLV